MYNGYSLPSNNKQKNDNESNRTVVQQKDLDSIPVTFNLTNNIFVQYFPHILLEHNLIYS